MVRARALLALTSMLALPLAARPATAEVIKVPVSFTVTNPTAPGGGPYTIEGFLMRPAGCSSSVILATHGLSYGQWAWDFPLEPETYSVARAMAARGYAMIAIDKLGYGASHGAGDPDQPNGYTLTVEGYADLTAQIIRQIRAGTYGGPAFGRVALMGHSAGTEISELATGLHPDLVDALIATAYTHVPFMNLQWLQDEWLYDNLRAAQSDYEEFEQGRRAQDMYDLEHADEDVVALDMQMANLTPSGEIFSIGKQPSRFVLPLITEPVLLVLAENDVLFPGSHGQNELQHFVSASDRTLAVIPDAGHTFMLHTNAPESNELIADWLDERQDVIPRCA